MSRVTISLMILLLMGTFLFTIVATPIDDERVIRIIDAETSSASITLGDETQPLPPEGYKFIVNVTLEGATNFLFKYQVAVAFDNTKVKCTGAWIVRNDACWVFYNETGAIMTSVSVYNNLGFAAFSSMLPSDYVVPNHEEFHHYVNVSQGILCQFNFTAISRGTSALEIIPTESPDYYSFDTSLWDKDEHHIDFDSENFSLTVLGISVSATVDACPRSLNLRSKGKWITVYIEFPEAYNVNDINISTIVLNDTIQPGSKPSAIGDYDGDGIPDLMVKFDRAEVISHILANVDVEELIEERFALITLTITGKLHDETPFQGSDAIKVIMHMPRNRRIHSTISICHSLKDIGVFWKFRISCKASKHKQYGHV